MKFTGSIGNGVGWEKKVKLGPLLRPCSAGALWSTPTALWSLPSQHPSHFLKFDLLFMLQTVSFCSLLHPKYRAQQMALNKLLNTHRLAG